MDSTRQLKYARLIQKELGEIFQRDAKDLFEGAFVTLTKVTVSPDLSIARVYMSFLLVKDKGEMIKKVAAQGKLIKKLLGERIRKQARVIPELHFHLDGNLDYAAKMEDIFSKISKPKQEDKEDQKDKNEQE